MDGKCKFGNCCSINHHTQIFFEGLTINLLVFYFNVYQPQNVLQYRNNLHRFPSCSLFDSELQGKVVVTTLWLSSWVTKSDHPHLCGKAVRNCLFQMGLLYLWPRGQRYQRKYCTSSLATWESAPRSSFLMHCHKWHHLSFGKHVTQNPIVWRDYFFKMIKGHYLFFC